MWSTVLVATVIAQSMANAPERTVQDPNPAILRGRLGSDATVIVTTDAGERIAGRISEISPQRLLLQPGAPPAEGASIVLEQAIEYSAIDRIELETTENYNLRWPLMAAGAAAGFAAVLVAVNASCAQPDCSGGDYGVLFGAILGLPVGALVGLGVGSGIHRTRTSSELLYERDRRIELFVTPLLGPRRTGVSFALRF